MPEIFRRQYLSSEDIVRVGHKIAQVPKRSDRLNEVFKEYVKIRIGNYPNYAKFQIWHLLRSRVRVLKTETVGVIGGCTNSKWRWMGLIPSNIYVFLNPHLPQDTAIYYKTLVHELEHIIQGIDLQTVNLDSVDKVHRQFYLEYGTSRAEYEFLQLVPKTDIAHSRNILKTIQNSQTALDLLLAADNSFETYRSKHPYGTIESMTAIYRSTFGEDTFDDTSNR